MRLAFFGAAVNNTLMEVTMKFFFMRFAPLGGMIG